MREVEGVGELVKLLTELKNKGAVRIVKASIRAGLVEVAKQMRRDVSPKAKAARPAIRHRLRGKKIIRAKVGVHVGKSRDKFPEPTRGGRSGKGISGRNLHWWVAGAKQRQTKRGQSRGQMPAQQSGLAVSAYAKSRGVTFSAMRRRAEIQLVREVAKRNRRR
jgi:hypothetical protein